MTCCANCLAGRLIGIILYPVPAGVVPAIDVSVPSLRDGPKGQTRNLGILRCATAHQGSMHRPGVTGAQSWTGTNHTGSRPREALPTVLEPEPSARSVPCNVCLQWK